MTSLPAPEDSQDGGPVVETRRSALPPHPPQPPPLHPECRPLGHDGQGGDGAVLEEEHQLVPPLVPPYHHLQLVPAHGDVHHPPRHRRGPQCRRLPLRPGGPAAARLLRVSAGAGEVAEPGPGAHPHGQVRPGLPLHVPHLERDPPPGVGPGERPEDPPAPPVGSGRPGPHCAVLRGAGRPVRRPPPPRSPRPPPLGRQHRPLITLLLLLRALRQPAPPARRPRQCAFCGRPPRGAGRGAAQRVPDPVRGQAEKGQARPSVLRFREGAGPRLTGRTGVPGA